MKRTLHYLKRNEASETPSNVIVVDTEAFLEETPEFQRQTFRLGYAIHMIRKGDTWYQRGYELTTIDDFWNLLDRCSYSKKRLYVYAHNMAYDYTILKLDSYISSRHLEIKMRVIDSVFIIKAGAILFLSSTNYYRQSLKSLGEIFGLAKMNSPDFQTVTDIELMRYCQRDTEVLASLISQHIKFIKENDLGCFKPTIAGQALTAYRHRFMSKQLLVHDYEHILELEKQSYRGGRCEAFRIGTYSNIFKLDINSMYPYVMKAFKYPTKPVTNDILTNCDEEHLRKSIASDKFVIADCDLILREPFVAVRRDKLLFPIGNVRQVVTQPEIQYILNHPEAGSIAKVHSMVAYHQDFIFNEYVDFFYKLKSENQNKAIVGMAKLFLNSLYGKFAQHCSSESERITDPGLIKMYLAIMSEEGTNEVFDGHSSRYLKIGEDIYHVFKMDGEFSHNSIPSIASAVTAYSRMLLYELIKYSQDCLYCDTDSLFVSEKAYRKLEAGGFVDPKELGKLKLEETGQVTIRGAKDYTFNDEVKLKGIKANAERISDSEYRQYQFETKNSRYLNGTADGIVLVRPVIKKISRLYDKGIVVGDTVFPLEFSDF